MLTGIVDLIIDLSDTSLNQLLPLGIGLLLVALIAAYLRNLPPEPIDASRHPGQCLLCGRALAVGHGYVDRDLPGWAACDDCYAALPPIQQRRYRAG